MLLGRDHERAVIDRLLDDARVGRSGAVVVRGEPGIGKSALLAYAVERAGDLRVLRATGVEAEGELPFAALHQVLWPVLDRLGAIPEPQAAALRGAFGLTRDSVGDRFLVSVAVLSLLAEVASERPVLCVVDDAHWLDGASADALAFAARRLEADPIALVFGARDADGRELSPAAGLTELALSGLEPGAAGELLASRSPRPLESHVQAALIAATGGNPLALIELPPALDADVLRGARELDGGLPLTAGIERAFLERASRLSQEARTLLLVVALDESGELGPVLAAAAAIGAGAQALDEAERAELVRVTGREIAFRHPLVRSAVQQSATFGARRAAHEALAQALDGEVRRDRRAWHHAAAAAGPDARVADELELCAGLALERAGFAAAAAALERAAELSVDQRARGRRLLAAARAAQTAGRSTRAAALLEAARPLLSEPAARGEHAAIAAEIALARGRPGSAFAALIEAAEQLEGGGALALLLTAVETAVIAGDFDGVQRAVDAGAAIEPDDTPYQLLIAFMLRGLARLYRGDPAAGAPLLERSLEHAAAIVDPRVVMLAATAAMHLGDEQRALALLDRGIAIGRGSGALGVLPSLLGLRAMHFLRHGRLEEVRVAAEEGLALARETGAENDAALPQAVLAAAAAISGRDDECEAMAAAALEIATRDGLAVPTGIALSALAHLDAARGRWQEALRRFDALAEARPGVGDPVLRIVLTPARVEAAARAGAADRAGPWIDAFEGWAVHARVPSAEALAAACRGLIAEGEQATAHFERALAGAGGARPFDRGRIQLWHGEHLRRQRRRAAAREQLRAARESFTQAGAGPWRERAERELRASGETVGASEAAPLAELTPRELQIGRLAAQGAANRDIAAQLFLSTKTVEYHLHKLFGKLGIASRAELARVPLGEP